MEFPTSTSVAHYGPSPARLPYERGTDGPRTVLVGVDGSDSSERACAYAAGMARRERCRLVIVFVAAPSGLAGLSGAVAGPYQLAMHDLAAEIRRGAQQIAEDIAVPTTFVHRNGDPYAQLRAAADEYKADVVVVGTATRARHRFLGSVGNRLVRLGRWPVVVVP